MPKSLSFLGRNLTIWIFVAMGVGIGLGCFLPSFPTWLQTFQQGSTNVPLAIGLILLVGFEERFDFEYTN